MKLEANLIDYEYITITFIVVSSISCFLLILSSLFFLLKSIYIILKTYSNHFCILQVFFAILDIWICFFTIYQLDPFEWFEWKSGCILWNYWFQYIAGIVPWLVIQHYKIIRHGFIFNDSMRQVKYAKRNTVTIIYIVMCNVPAIILCTVITMYYGLSNDFTQDMGCGIDYRLRLGFFGWVLIQFVVMIITTFVIHRGIQDIYTKDYNSIKHIAVYGLLVSLFLFLIQMLQLESNPLWKLIYVITRASFYLFAFLRSIGFSLLMAIKGDSTYLRTMCNSLAFYDVILENIPEISFSSRLIANFLKWVKDKEPKEDTRFNNKKNVKKFEASIVVDPKEFAALYSSIKEWKEKYSETKSSHVIKELHTSAEQIYKNYLAGNKKIFPKTIVKTMKKKKKTGKLDKNFFHVCECFILDTFDYLWGDEYMDNMMAAHHTQKMQNRVRLLKNRDPNMVDSTADLMTYIQESESEDSDFVNGNDSQRRKNIQRKDSDL